MSLWGYFNFKKLHLEKCEVWNDYDAVESAAFVIYCGIRYQLFMNLSDIPSSLADT